MRRSALLLAVSGVVTFALTVATAGTFTMSDAPGAIQESSLQSVRSDVRDQFTVTSTSSLQGQVSDFHNGAGWSVDGGPIWNTFTAASPSADWTSYGADYVRRPSGGVGSAALVRWLTRESTVSVQMRQLATSTLGGVVMGADPTASSGLMAVAYWDGSQYQFVIVLITGAASYLFCSPTVPMGTNAGNTWSIQMTFDPGAGSPAVAQLQRSGGGGGTFTATSTCSTASASGHYSGMYSVLADNARYDNFSAVL